MTADADLLAAILADPHDDLPRLVLADWLEQHAGTVPCGRCNKPDGLPPGQIWYRSSAGSGYIDCPACSGSGSVSDGRAERAELIRVQCEWFRLMCWRLPHNGGTGTGPDPAKERRERAAELKRRAKELWVDRAIVPGLMFPPVKDQAFESDRDHFLTRHMAGSVLFRWSRGFIGQAEMPLSVFMQHAADLFARHPVTAVTLVDREPTRDDGVWRWASERCLPHATSLNPAARLPNDIWDRLPGTTPGRQFWSAGYHSRNQALSALRDVAAPNYGRGVAAGRTHEADCNMCGNTLPDGRKAKRGVYAVEATPRGNCPICGERGVWRTGVHFDHEMRCPPCGKRSGVTWEPGKRDVFAAPCPRCSGSGRVTRPGLPPLPARGTP